MQATDTPSTLAETPVVWAAASSVASAWGHTAVITPQDRCRAAKGRCSLCLSTKWAPERRYTDALMSTAATKLECARCLSAWGTMEFCVLPSATHAAHALHPMHRLRALPYAEVSAAFASAVRLAQSVALLAVAVLCSAWQLRQ